MRIVDRLLTLPELLLGLGGLALVACGAPAFAAGPIASGSTVAGSVSGPTFLESWTFSGTTGQRVVITAVTTSGAINTNIVLKKPGGAIEVTTSSDRVEAQLTATGTYTIEIQDVGLNDPGSYALGYLNVTVGPLTSPGDLDGGPIVSADVKTGTASGAADMDAFTFSGTNGQRILIDAVETAGAGYNTVIYLYPPGGGTFATWTGGGNRLDFQLTSTGTWTILIEDVSNDTAGSFNASFLNVTSGPYTGGPETDGGPIVSGVPRAGSALAPADFDGYTFSGSNGDSVGISTIVTLGAMNTQITLFPPGGGAALVSTATDNVALPLTATGVYTIVVEDSGIDQIGNYTVSLNLVPGGPTGVPDLPGDTHDDAEVLASIGTALLPASPSPFRESTRFRFSVEREGPVQLNVFDITGARVRSLVDRSVTPGLYPITWDGRDDGGRRVASGIYYVQLVASEGVRNEKVVRIR